GSFGAYNGQGNNRFVRLNDDGSADTFGSPPGLAAAFGGSTVGAVVFDPSSRLSYVGGPFETFNGISRKSIIAMNPDGSMNTAFTPGSGFDSDVRALVLDAPSGKLYAGGGFTSYNGTGISGIARLNLDGSLDTGFDPG